MPFKWNATYNFNYPLLDKPIDVNGIKLYPAQPDNTTHPTCIHYYEFETNDIGGDGKTEAMRKAQERLKELIELAALAKYRTEVSFHSLVLVDVEVNQGFLPGGVNFNFAGPPYFPPGQNPVVIRQKFETSAAYYQRIRELDIDIQKIIRRSLRWYYRASDHNLLGDERLIYGWISFNGMYSLFKSISGHDVNGERGCIQEFENAFRETVGQLRNNTDLLANSGIQLTRGNNRNVSFNLEQSIENDLPDLTHKALECVYAVRCSLFHGDEEPIIENPDPLFVSCSKYLNEYLKKVIVAFITYCENNT